MAVRYKKQKTARKCPLHMVSINGYFKCDGLTLIKFASKRGMLPDGTVIDFSDSTMVEPVDNPKMAPK